MITSFGKFARQIRIRRNLFLKDMAKDLGVSPAFLSAVESGGKSVPRAWQDQISELYELSVSDRLALDLAIVESKTSLTVDLATASAGRRSAVIALARKFDDLTDDDLRNLLTKIEQR